MIDSKIETYLAENLDRLDEIVEQVSRLIPPMFWHKPLIDNAYFTRLRQDIHDLEIKSRFSAYSHDNSVKRHLAIKRIKYQLALAELEKESRQRYQDYLLSLPLEEKAWCLFYMIKKHRLLKYLRKYR